jgi:hypothetical protein
VLTRFDTRVGCDRIFKVVQGIAYLRKHAFARRFAEELRNLEEMVASIQVRLEPVDDLNFANNLGQENTDVGHAGSPVAFSFRLRNDTLLPHRYHFLVDGYSIPPRDPCDGPLTPEERRRRLQRHQTSLHQLPSSWAVLISPTTPSLGHADEIPIAVTITPPDGWSGSQPVNVNIYHEGGFIGGVTLIVQKGV